MACCSSRLCTAANAGSVTQVSAFQIPPRPAAGGHRSGDWKVADKVFTGRLRQADETCSPCLTERQQLKPAPTCRVLSKGEVAEVLLIDPNRSVSTRSRVHSVSQGLVTGLAKA